MINISRIDKSILQSYILENIDIGIRAIDKDGKVIYCNDVMEKISDIKKEDMLGKHILELHQDLEGSSSTLLKCLKFGKKIENKIKIQTDKHGELIYLVTTNIPINQDGQIIGAVEYVKTKESYGDLFYFLSKDNKELEKELGKSPLKKTKGYVFEDFYTIEKELVSLIDKIKDMSFYDYNVLICGETGTGKEIISQSIHNRSPRRNNAFVAQNCAAIPETLLESIFFGTEVGSFTGATDSPGLFEQANGGTLLLDELNSLPIFLQAKLLRVLQENRIRRIGGNKDIEIDVRIICTTNERPDILIKENRLREDLFYRLGPILIDIPPLRNRKADIDYLARIFFKKESKALKRKEPLISINVKEFFRKYPWQGNVRELKNVVSYILLNSQGADVIELEHLPNYMKENIFYYDDMDFEYGNFNYHEKIIDYEKKIIKHALDTTKGNISEASKLLGIKRSTLQYKVSKMRLE